MSEDRDILIELRADMKHVRERVDHLANSDERQWERLDAQGLKIEGHEKTLYFLVRGFWLSVAGMGTVAWAWFRGNR